MCKSFLTRNSKIDRTNNELQAECTILSNDTETVAWVYADVKHLKIMRAGWAKYRVKRKLRPGRCCGGMQAFGRLNL